MSIGVLAALCATVLGWRCWLVAHGSSADYLNMATDTRVDAILIGCLLAMARNPRLDHDAARDTRNDWAIATVSLLLLSCTLIVRDEVFRLTARYTLQSLAIAGLIYLAVARADQLPFRWLNARPLVYVGTISYSIYLSHHVILLAVAKHWPQWSGPGWLFVSAALTLAVAEPMRRWVEQPCARLRARLHRESAARPIAPGALSLDTP
jgi:peptidoglycan/LPS O-acetylase OafA/YrhL